MKTMVFRFICLLVMLVPLAAASQTNIKSAFDAILKCPKAEIEESHGLDKDRETNIKLAEYDSYIFVIPSGKSGLVKNVLAAFGQDKDKAYYVKTGKNKSAQSTIQLYTGDNNAIPIDDLGYEYIYELFAPSKSEDPDGTHRYAYGFNYKEEDGNIKGRIVISYATTSEYRQQEQRARDLEYIAEMGKANGTSAMLTNGRSWFEEMMLCLTAMSNASAKSRIALATKAYNLVRDLGKFPDVPVQDKQTIVNILKLTMKDIGDPIPAELLRQCLAGLQ